MIIALTGHRPEKLGKEYDLKGKYSDAIRARLIEILQEKKPEKCISGMALGADMLFATVALSLGIPLIAAIPFMGQESIWPKSSQDRYNEILANPLTEKVIVSEGRYSNQKLQVRNEWMVDHCDFLIAIWDGSAGGTGNCMKYAKDRKPYQIINPNTLFL